MLQVQLTSAELNAIHLGLESIVRDLSNVEGGNDFLKTFAQKVAANGKDALEKIAPFVSSGESVTLTTGKRRKAADEKPITRTVTPGSSAVKKSTGK